MKTQNHFVTTLRQFGFFPLWVLAPFFFIPNPISIQEKPLTPEIAFLITFSILLEATCILLLLRHWRRPRFFIIWIIGIHLLTYPAFLSFLWLLQDMRPALAVAFGESLVVLVEGILIYLICHYVPTKQNFPTPSLFRCWLVSMAGNACSLIAFPFLTHFYSSVFG